MVSGLAEVLVGYRRDPETGPIVVLGIGGVLAEIYGDATVRPAPVDATTAREMIHEVRGLAPIRGYRNMPKGDLDALAEAVAAVSRLAVSNAHVSWKRKSIRFMSPRSVRVFLPLTPSFA